jgi:hypothetical protein
VLWISIKHPGSCPKPRIGTLEFRGRAELPLSRKFPRQEFLKVSDTSTKTLSTKRHETPSQNSERTSGKILRRKPAFFGDDGDFPVESRAHNKAEEGEASSPDAQRTHSNGGQDAMALGVFQSVPSMAPALQYENNLLPSKRISPAKSFNQTGGSGQWMSPIIPRMSPAPITPKATPTHLRPWEAASSKPRSRLTSKSSDEEILNLG